MIALVIISSCELKIILKENFVLLVMGIIRGSKGVGHCPLTHKFSEIITQNPFEL